MSTSILSRLARQGNHTEVVVKNSDAVMAAQNDRLAAIWSYINQATSPAEYEARRQEMAAEIAAMQAAVKAVR